MILTVYFLLYAGAKELLRRRAEKKENECKPNIRLRAPMQKCRSDVFEFPVNSKTSGQDRTAAEGELCR